MSLCAPAYAQQGSIKGYIVDQNGRPLADLTVRLTRVAFGQQFKAKTDISGNYFHAGLPEGEYEVSICKDGHLFKLSTHVDVRIAVIQVIEQGDTRVIGTQERSGGGDAVVNFDLRLLAPYDPEQQRKVAVSNLHIPRKAEDEFKKAFDAKDDLGAAKQHLEKAIEIAPN